MTPSKNDCYVMYRTTKYIRILEINEQEHEFTKLQSLRYHMLHMRIYYMCTVLQWKSGQNTAI